MPAKAAKAAKAKDKNITADQPDVTQKPEKRSKKDKPKKKKGFPIIPVLVLVVIIGGIVAVLAFNVLGIREQYIMPYLRNAPLIGGLFPSASPVPEGETDNAYTGMTTDELQAQITQLSYQIQKLEADLKAAEDQNAQDAETIRVLRSYESQWDTYKQVKAEYDAMVVSGDPNGYAQFFTSVSPENAEDLYTQSLAQVQYTADEKRNANIYANMSPDVAAAGLEQMLLTDSALVVRILRNMDALHIADIYNEMTTANLAVISRLMAPTPAPVITARTAPPLPDTSSVKSKTPVTTETPITTETPPPVDITPEEAQNP